MKKFWRWIKNAWGKIKGKKRNVGILLLLALRGISVFFPDMLEQDKIEFIRLIIDIGLVGGMADNLSRTKTAKKYVNLIKKKGAKNG